MFVKTLEHLRCKKHPKHFNYFIYLYTSTKYNTVNLKYFNFQFFDTELMFTVHHC